MTTKILFVCLGNICRSPAAENIMNSLIEQQGLENYIQCDSAGTGGYHVGANPDRRMQAAALTRGITIVGSARLFVPKDFEEFDLILAMDKSNYRDILSLDILGKYHHKVHLICRYCKQHTAEEVPDPYYGGPEGFNYVLDLLSDACQHLLNSLKTSMAKN